MFPAEDVQGGAAEAEEVEISTFYQRHPGAGGDPDPLRMATQARTLSMGHGGEPSPAPGRRR
jgi:hypothetical protein